MPLLYIIVLWYDKQLITSQKENTPQKKQQKINDNNPSLSLKKSKKLFVPYWTLSGIKETYDALIYFGLSVDENGIDKDDPGYIKLSDFNNLSKNAKKLLTIRMLNNDINFKVLDNELLQKKIIDESISIALDNSFDGLVLDLEVNALPFESFMQKINKFVDVYSKSAHENSLTLAMTMYGDAIFRGRPYDLSVLAKSVDEIMIMAYDFHKAKGNPGPNFPYGQISLYGYDFAQMVTDFLTVIPKDKITVIFGMFGYDWNVNEKGQSVGEAAKALSLAEIRLNYQTNCKFKECRFRRDDKIFETVIDYIDESEKHHKLWFEDEFSVEKKRLYLEQNGLQSIALWANTYF